MADDFSHSLYTPYRNPSIEEHYDTKSCMNIDNGSFMPSTTNTDLYTHSNANDYKGIPNNLNWTGSQSYNSPMYVNPDDEVTFITNHKSDQHLSTYEDSRCSSTDTTFSSASYSTMYSNSSINDFDNFVEDDTFVPPLDRKRKLNQEEAKVSTKYRNRNTKLTYKRWPKPPYSYTGLIATVIMNSKNGSLTLTEIIQGLSELFPFFRGSYQGWKDSTRNYLSKFSCFVKVHDVVLSHRTHLWTVDKSKLSAKMFLRQDRKNAVQGDFKATIQEQLNLPPVDIPGFGYVTTKKRKSLKLSETTAITPKPIQTGQTVRNKTIMKLPKFEDCLTQTESPFSTYPFKRQESLVSEVNKESSAHDTSFPEIQTGTPSSSYYEDWFYSATLNDVKQFIQSERRTSQAAVEHLNSLCFADVNGDTPSNKENVDTKVTSIRDIDADISPCLEADDTYEDLSVVKNWKHFTDYSISSIVMPSTQVKDVGNTIETEYLDISDDDDDEMERLVSL